MHSQHERTVGQFLKKKNKMENITDSWTGRFLVRLQYSKHRVELVKLSKKLISPGALSLCM